ncbi:MAG TPA: helix-turn-helix domain-containing protein [Candidatus Elarobacter sp.]
MDAVLSDSRLSHAARLTYYFIKFYCDAFANDWTSVSQSTLGELVGVHRVTIAEHTKALVAAGYISENAAPAGAGRTAKRYTLKDVPARIVGEPMSTQPMSGQPYTNNTKSTEPNTSNSATTYSNRGQMASQRDGLTVGKRDAGEYAGADGGGSPPQTAGGVTAGRCRVSQHPQQGDPAKTLRKVANQVRYQGGDEKAILDALKAHNDFMSEPFEEADLKRIADKVCAWKKGDPMLIGMRAA